jgi:GNAT superfamily N-acetyltransferase
MKVRRAVKEDCPRLMELVRELADYVKLPHEVTVSPESFVEDGFGKNPVWWAIVAEENGKIEGFALYYIRYSTWKGKRMFLEDLIVTEKMRGRGIGKLLMDRLIEEAREKKFDAIVWQVMDWNERAFNFYKKYNAERENNWVNCMIKV